MRRNFGRFALGQLLFLCFFEMLGMSAWAIPTDPFVMATRGTERSYFVVSVPPSGGIPYFACMGARLNSEWTKRHVLADQFTVNGALTTVVRNAPQGYAEYWQFGGGARLHRIDEGDYDDQLGIGVLNRKNVFSPAVPVISGNAAVGSTLDTQGTVVRIYNDLVQPRTMQFTSHSLVSSIETVELDGSAHRAFRVLTTIDMFDAIDEIVLAITNLFVGGIGLVPVQTKEMTSSGGGFIEILNYTPFHPTSHPTDQITIPARVGVPPGAAIDGVVHPGRNWVNGNLPLLYPQGADAYVANGQFTGQDYPPSSLSRLQSTAMIRVRAPASPNATACAFLTIGPQSAGQFCVTSSDMSGQPQSGLLQYSEWSDFVGVGSADFANFTGYRALHGTYVFDNVVNDKAYDIEAFFADGCSAGVRIAMPDNGWPRPGRFGPLDRGHASFAYCGRGCNVSTSILTIQDVQYNTNRDITSLAADIEQHCENHPEAYYASFRYNSSVPYTTFSSPGLDAGTTLNLLQGWNLVGNSSNVTATVASLFANPNWVQSVWKWSPSNQRWAFYSPTLGDGGAAVAASRGYDYLTQVGGGEGFWVNAKTTFSVTLPAATPLASTSFKSLKPGWSLISVGDSPSPRTFVSDVGPLPPAVGDIPLNLKSLWAWDPSGKWYFYAPSLDNAGTLSSFTTTRGYLDFGTTKKLDSSMGIWVNK